MNVSVLEEWVGQMGLPRGVQSHFAPVRDLLNWLQVHKLPRNTVDFCSSLTTISVSLVYRRLLKFNRDGTDDAKSQSPASESSCTNGCSGTNARNQMRRAVRDYRYEVNEGRMTEECSQYLVQLQKDWEKHRVRLGVEALRKEVRISF
jgi:hypothetical protein